MYGLFVFTPVSEVGERNLGRAGSDSDIRPMSAWVCHLWRGDPIAGIPCVFVNRRRTNIPLPSRPPRGWQHRATRFGHLCFAPLILSIPNSPNLRVGGSPVVAQQAAHEGQGPVQPVFKQHSKMHRYRRVQWLPIPRGSLAPRV